MAKAKHTTTFKTLSDLGAFNYHPAFSLGLSEKELEKRKAKLLEAAYYLRDLKLPKKALFDFSLVGEHVGDHPPKEENYCGTTACAMGWLGLTNQFGFKPVWETGTEVRGDEKEVTTHSLTVKSKKYDSLDFDAMVDEFGLADLNVAYWLFNPGQAYSGCGIDATKEEVAANMEFVAKFGVYPVE